MASKNVTNYTEFEAELLQRPEVRRKYEALKPKYDLIRNIIKRRNELKISQKDLARIVGTRQPAISRLEKGDYNMTLGTFFKVINALELNFSLDSKKHKVHA